MSDILSIFDLSHEKTAVISNFLNITETQELNNIYTLQFSIPADDRKVKHLQPFHFVRYRDGQLYRIISTELTNNEQSTLVVKCEHVIATLCDNILFGSYVYNSSLDKTQGATRNAIEWILSHQSRKNWVLDKCDFDLLYEYSWEQENLLNALYSIPKEFVDPFMWDFDTKNYPWKLSLKKINVHADPAYYIRAEKNLLESTMSKDYGDICTRLYPLGYGEGVNQLTIRDENNDIPYLEAPKDVIEKYGKIEKVLVDRSFENAKSLKAHAQQVLNGYLNPGLSRSFDVVDLYPITSRDIDNAKVGKICRMTQDNTTAYITKTVRNYDKPGDLQIELSTKVTDVVNQIADLADRVRIESVYAQGATQVYQQSKDANAGPSVDKGHVISLYFPSEMKQINKVLLQIRLKSFRAYSQTTSGGGATAKATESGGSTAKSTESGGGQGQTGTGYTEAGVGGNIYEAWAYDSYAVPTSNELVNSDGSHWHTVDRSWFKHSHDFDMSANSHSHTYDIPSHTHEFSVPSHTHDFSVPEHTHSIVHGIFEASNHASSFSIYVSGTKKTDISSTSWDGDITEWLLSDSGGTIPRNSWIDVTIVPNDLAYVISSVFVQGFVQSRGGGNY